MKYTPADALAAFHAIHLRAVVDATDLTFLDARARVALEDAATLAQVDARAAGHLVRATSALIRAREREVYGMRVDQGRAIQSRLAEVTR